ncbi:peptidoglycan-binding domain-containing protein [uncultured Cohaesibacter sp.]|uniref:peptidoglycan-binding domain-containing protein n=1 Tax=uncultured Cohaesibacter sp. TaxID=1002546 RepID=UPI00292E4C68|nr:peptidoglycan-binding domain-containing protein [uncultured Cohaesibacter sp.]
MKKSLIFAIFLSLAFSNMSVQAFARSGDFFAGTIIGGVLGVIAGSANSHRYYRKPAPRPRYSMSAEQRAFNKSVQKRLNSLGFNAGYVDGVLGRRSKAAIRSFQTAAGFSASGYLKPDQVSVLFSSDFEKELFGNRSPTEGAPVAGEDGYSSSQSPAGQDTARADTENGLASASPMEDPEQENGRIKPLTGANTSMMFKKGAPSLFGIILGQGYASAQDILARNGYDLCNDNGEFVTCTSEQEDVSKRFKLARSLSVDGQPIYMMDSETNLVIDGVDQSIIENKLAEAYPELSAAPNKVISDNANCALKMSRLSSVETFLERLETARQDRNAALSDTLKSIVDRCDVFYKGDISKTSDGYSVRVIMFKGTYLRDVSDTLTDNKLDDNKLDKVNDALKF